MALDPTESDPRKSSLTGDPALARSLATLLAESSGKPVRRYSTFEFGRGRDGNCLSVVVPEPDAQQLVFDLRERLPLGSVAFVGTTQWLGDEKHEGGAEVVVGKGDSQFDIPRLARTDACNYDLTTENLVSKLRAWDLAFGIDIFHAETDTVELTLAELPHDVLAFASEVYEFCPDIIDQGLGSVGALAEAIRDYSYLYLWWD